MKVLMSYHIVGVPVPGLVSFKNFFQNLQVT